MFIQIQSVFHRDFAQGVFVIIRFFSAFLLKKETEKRALLREVQVNIDMDYTNSWKKSWRASTVWKKRHPGKSIT